MSISKINGILQANIDAINNVGSSNISKVNDIAWTSGSGPTKLSTPAIPILQYTKGRIFVQFDDPTIAEDSYVESHEIWRAVGGLFVLYDTVTWAGASEYWDMTVSLGNTYGYKIKRISNDGGTDDSNLSLPGVITI